MYWMPKCIQLRIVELPKVMPKMRFPAESVTYIRYYAQIVSKKLFSPSYQQINSWLWMWSRNIYCDIQFFHCNAFRVNTTFIFNFSSALVETVLHCVLAWVLCAIISIRQIQVGLNFQKYTPLLSFGDNRLFRKLSSSYIFSQVYSS